MTVKMLTKNCEIGKKYREKKGVKQTMKHFRPGLFESGEISLEFGGHVHVYPSFKSWHCAVGSQSLSFGSKHSLTASLQSLPVKTTHSHVPQINTPFFITTFNYPDVQFKSNVTLWYSTFSSKFHYLDDKNQNCQTPFEQIHYIGRYINAIDREWFIKQVEHHNLGLEWRHTAQGLSDLTQLCYLETKGRSRGE